MMPMLRRSRVATHREPITARPGAHAITQLDRSAPALRQPVQRDRPLRTERGSACFQRQSPQQPPPDGGRLTLQLRAAHPKGRIPSLHVQRGPDTRSQGFQCVQIGSCGRRKPAKSTVHRRIELAQKRQEFAADTVAKEGQITVAGIMRGFDTESMAGRFRFGTRDLQQGTNQSWGVPAIDGEWRAGAHACEPINPAATNQVQQDRLDLIIGGVASHDCVRAELLRAAGQAGIPGRAGSGFQAGLPRVEIDCSDLQRNSARCREGVHRLPEARANFGRGDPMVDVGSFDPPAMPLRPFREGDQHGRGVGAAGNGDEQSRSAGVPKSSDRRLLNAMDDRANDTGRRDMRRRRHKSSPKPADSIRDRRARIGQEVGPPRRVKNPKPRPHGRLHGKRFFTWTDETQIFPCDTFDELIGVQVGSKGSQLIGLHTQFGDLMLRLSDADVQTIRTNPAIDRVEDKIADSPKNSREKSDPQDLRGNAPLRSESLLHDEAPAPPWSR